jgi:predicted DNA-binding transcriptional regulator YafY
MSRSMGDTASRLLELLALLQTRREWAGNELADRLEVSGRTIRRDIERLRQLGYPVQSLSGPAGGYRLRAGTAMPPLLLDDEEAIAIAVGLSTAARASVASIEETALRALLKLEQVLPSHLRRRVRALGSTTFTLPAAGPTVDPQHLTVIAAACRDAECLRFAYRSREGSETRRDVEPHSLVNRGHRWYLVAWDRGRGDWRTFRIDRLSRPASTGVRFKAHDLPANDAAAFVEGSIAAAPSRFEALVILHAPADRITRRLPFHLGAIKPLDARTCEYRTGDDDIEWLALRIAMLGVDFEVQEPPELADHVRALAARFDRAAG